MPAHRLPQKRKAEAKAEFEAEQEYLKTVSLLSEEEQKKYKERQVSSTYFGYTCAVRAGG